MIDLSARSDQDDVEPYLAQRERGLDRWIAVHLADSSDRPTIRLQPITASAILSGRG